MSEENKVIYCNNCGGENPADFKFCSSCGTKLVVPVPENPMQPVYEKVEAEIMEENNTFYETAESAATEEPILEDTYTSKDVILENPTFQKEIDIHYGPDAASDPQITNAVAEQMIAASEGKMAYSIVSMVCGILSLLCCCSGWVGLILAVIAIVFGIMSIKNNQAGKGMAIAGLITGGISVLCIVLLLIIGGFSDVFTDMMNDIAG